MGYLVKGSLNEESLDGKEKDMAKLSIRLGDDNNREWKKDVEIEVDGTTALLIKDRLRTAEYADYTRAWDKMLDCISAQCDDLPYDWFVDHIDRD